MRFCSLVVGGVLLFDGRWVESGGVKDGGLVMKLCIFQWYWYEECDNYILVHDKNKSQEEFKADCVNALRKCGGDYLKKEEGWASAQGWIEAAAEYMVNNMGYRRPEQDVFAHFGSYLICHDEGQGLNDEDKRWKEIVGEQLFSKAQERNRKIEERLSRERVNNDK